MKAGLLSYILLINTSIQLFYKLIMMKNNPIILKILSLRLCVKILMPAGIMLIEDLYWEVY